MVGADESRRMSTAELLPNLAGASLLCSAAIIEFTIPQIVRLSATTSQPLPHTPLFPARAAIFARSIAPQTVLTIAQFALVRELRDVIDDARGPSPINLSIAYGTASVPFIAAKYVQVYIYLFIFDPFLPLPLSYSLLAS